MPTTSNFGWTTPADTDLVKDGAAAIRTLGNGIDSSFVDLKGGTTNQVLAKNSNTDLDFKWVADATGIPATILDAKGDIIAASAADTAARLAVGANGTVLTADSAEATGLKWATPAALGWTQLATGSLTGSSVSITGLSKKEYYVFCDGWSHNDASNQGLRIRFNNDTGSNYGSGNAASGDTSILLCAAINPSGTPGKTIAYVLAAGDTEEVKTVLVPVNSGTTQGGNYFSTTAITSIQLFPNAGDFDAGTYYIYGRG